MDFREWLDGVIGSREDASGFELYYTGGEAKGSLHAERDRSNPDLYRVTRVWAKPEGMGHGKKLYMSALGMASKRGGMLAPARNSTSDSASNVWRSLYGSAGVERVPLSARDWPETPRNSRMMGGYPGLRFSDPSTYPPGTDTEFWTFNSGYRTSQKAQISPVGASVASAGSRMGSGSKTPSGASAGVQDDGLTLDDI
jgi:hypothetical protein